MNSHILPKNAFKILEFLLKNIEEYNINQIARVLKLSVGSVHKLLKEFKEREYVKENRMGNAIYYSLNLNNKEIRKLLEIILIELKNNILRKNTIARIFSKELENYKAKAIILFGSILTKKEKANDVDVLFIIKNKEEVKKINNFCLEISKLRTKTVVPLIMTENDLKNKIKERNKTVSHILKNSIILKGEEIIINSIKNGKN